MVAKKVTSRKKVPQKEEIIDPDFQEIMPTPIENFDEFFDGDENVKLQLFRLFPKEYLGCPTSGFIDYLVLGDDFKTVSERYGGGKYRIAKVVNGRFSRQNVFTIAGNPKVEPTVTGRAGVQEGTPNASGMPARFDSDEVHRDIPIDGTVDEFMERVTRVRMINQLFPEQKDTNINDALLQMLIENQNRPAGISGVMSEVKDLLGIVNELKGEGSGSEGSFNWKEIAKTAMEFFASKKAADVNTVVSPAPAVGQNDPPPMLTPQERENDVITKILDQTTSAVCECYFSPNGMTAEECVDIVKGLIPGFGEEVRKQIVVNGAIIKNVARMKFKAFYDDDFEKRADENSVYDMDERYKRFEKYYDRVLAILADENAHG